MEEVDLLLEALFGPFTRDSRIPARRRPNSGPAQRPVDLALAGAAGRAVGVDHPHTTLTGEVSLPKAGLATSCPAELDAGVDGALDGCAGYPFHPPDFLAQTGLVGLSICCPCVPMSSLKEAYATVRLFRSITRESVDIALLPKDIWSPVESELETSL